MVNISITICSIGLEREFTKNDIIYECVIFPLVCKYGVFAYKKRCVLC